MASRGVINLNSYAAMDGVTDDGPALAAAVDDLRAYTGGQGGGTLLLPEGILQVASSVTVWDAASQGVSLIGAGSQSSYIRGSVSGPILTNDSATQEVWNRIQGLSISNQSTNVAAKALATNNMNELLLRDVNFYSTASGSGSSIVDFTSTYNLRADHCRFGSVGPDHCISMGGSVNNIQIVKSILTDCKGGVSANIITGFVFTGNDFESLAGSATDGKNGCLYFVSARGGQIAGNYGESDACPFLVAGVSPTFATGVLYGGNFLTNLGDPAVDASQARNSTFLPDYLIPGAHATNQNGFKLSANTSDCVFFPSKIESGTGLAIQNPTLGTRNTHLSGAGLLTTMNDVAVGVAGKGLQIKEGSNAKMGANTLVAGTVTVSTTAVTANSRILLTGQNSSGTHGELTVSARTAGTSFTITSSNGADTRSVAWMLVEPA